MSEFKVNDYLSLKLEDNETYIPRGGSMGTWYKLFLPYLGNKDNTGDYRDVKIYRCRSFPNKKQTVCYVVSSWTFDSRTDDEGDEVTEPTKLKTFIRPMYTVYLADNEDGDGRPIIEDEDDPYQNLLDVWNPSHLPKEPPANVIGSTGRRVSEARHKKGSNYLFLDWHVEYIATDDMSIDYWRDK